MHFFCHFIEIYIIIGLVMMILCWLVGVKKNFGLVAFLWPIILWNLFTRFPRFPKLINHPISHEMIDYNKKLCQIPTVIYQPGDRVRCIEETCLSPNIKPGMKGTILGVYGKIFYGIEWDEEVIHGHDLYPEHTLLKNQMNLIRPCKNGYGFFLPHFAVKKEEISIKQS